MCLLPVFKGEGHFVMVAQTQPDMAGVLLTHLQDYQANPNHAQPYMSLTIFTEVLQVRQKQNTM